MISSPALCLPARSPCFSDGTPWRPLIDVRDMARAIEWAISRTAERGGKFLAVNAGSSGWNYQVKDLAHAVAASVPATNRFNQYRSSRRTSVPTRSTSVSSRSLAPEHQPLQTLETSVAGLRDGLHAIEF